MNHVVNLCESKISIEKTTQLWRFENFKFLPFVGSTSFYSSIFESEKSKNQWKLLINYGCKDILDDIDISLESVNKGNIRVKIELSILNSMNDKLKCLNKSHYFNNNNNFNCILTFEKFIKMSELTDNIDCLQILCEITEFRNSPSIKRSIKNINITDIKVENSLLEDLKNLLTNNDQPFNITLKCNDGVEVRVHKFILMARSKFFNSMFKHDTKDKEKTSISIFSEFGNASSDAVKQMVEFLYTDEVNEISKNTQDLLLLSDLYDLKKLKLLCENELIKMINLINCGDLLIWSDICNAVNLKKKVLEFFKKQPKIIATSNDWIKDILNVRPDLYRDIFNSMIENVEE